MKQAWSIVELGTVLHQVDRAEPSASLGEISLAGVYGFGKGLFERGPLVASTTSYKSYNRLVEGDFVISQPKAWEGAIAAVTEQFDGWYLSPVFPVFRPLEKLLSLSYLHWYCQQPFVWEQLKFLSTGMGARRETVSPKQFLSLKIPLPSLEKQQQITARINTVQQKMQAADELRASIDKDITSLLAVRFQETLTHAKWLPMNEVAPIVRRDVTVNHQSNYAELGIRSFGKGTFHKPTLSGLELGDKRVYRIEPGDLLFSNVFAWEGAIAVAQPEDSGRVGSHRFISCVPHDGLTTAEYLRYYFLTDAGITKIRDASPGGAGRNRTLGLSKLMDLDVPIPSIEVRKSFVNLLRLMNASRLIRSQELSENESVVPALVNRLMA